MHGEKAFFPHNLAHVYLLFIQTLLLNVYFTITCHHPAAGVSNSTIRICPMPPVKQLIVAVLAEGSRPCVKLTARLKVNTVTNNWCFSEES